WIKASGKAKVGTFTVMVGMEQVEPKFWEDMPYVLAMVDLEEGIRMMTRIVDCEPDDVAINMEVEVTFEDISANCALPYFRPIGK
ncbi:MAG: OB-fold domain-containing protein, partial [Proteobacteria bacterium]|nr:OB-fold domain-containing protein [Pseudomonadota bacterium]